MIGSLAGLVGFGVGIVVVNLAADHDASIGGVVYVGRRLESAHEPDASEPARSPHKLATLGPSAPQSISDARTISEIGFASGSCANDALLA